jgi:hypothetical protein
MIQTIFCKHYRAMSEHKTCKADVNYADLPVGPNRPCFWERCDRRGIALDPMPAPPTSCSLASFPTEAEIAADEIESHNHFAKIRMAREAIVANLGGPWKRGTQSARGYIDCPVCDAKDSLSFMRSGYNGHIHARCNTPGCVAWME